MISVKNSQLSLETCILVMLEEITMQLLVYFTLCSVRSTLHCEQDLPQKRSKYVLNIIRLYIPDGSSSRCAWNTGSRCPGGTLITCPYHFSWILSMPRSTSTLRLCWISQLNLRLMVVKGFVSL